VELSGLLKCDAVWLQKYTVMATHPIHCQNSEDLNIQQNCCDYLRSHFFQVPCL